MKQLWKLLAVLLCLTLLVLPCAAVMPQAVIPGGQAIGLAMQIDGVYVTAFSDPGNSPAEKAGVKPGDRITAINEIPITIADNIPSALAQADGAPVRLRLLRDEKPVELLVEPVRSGTEWKLGLYVRDRVAGIGTLTYVDPETLQFGALGHAIHDAKGRPIPLRAGQVLPVTLNAVTKSRPGNPGALTGTWESDLPLGTVTENLPAGVFGRLEAAPQASPIPVAAASEIEKGPVTILCSLDDSGVQRFAAEITAIRPQDPDLRHLRLRITDPALLEAAGGIVQGISGAPILQNGKLVGAVTHVLIEQPDRGYGIFIGEMLQSQASEKPDAAAA